MQHLLCILVFNYFISFFHWIVRTEFDLFFSKDRTGRILFKLFDKDPSHMPGSLRDQVSANILVLLCLLFYFSCIISVTSSRCLPGIQLAL